MNPTTPSTTLPGLRPTPVLGPFGSYIRFLADQLHWLAELSRLGPLVTLARGDTRYLFVFDPDLNQQVLSDPVTFRSLELWNVAPAGSSLRTLWSGLLTTNGEVHKRHRRLMMPAFHKKKVETYRDDMVAQIERTLDGWRPGDVRDMLREMRDLTLLIITRVLFGLEDDAAALRTGRLMAEWFERYTAPVNHLLPYDAPGLPYRKLLALSRAGEAAIRGFIAQKRARGLDGDDVLSMLLHARDEDGSALSDAELIGQTNILFVAGHETTTNALTWTLLLLEQHPDVLAALLDELHAELRGAPPTVAQLERLPLLDRVISESLRLLPPVPTAFRRSAAPFEMRGHAFGAGTMLFYSPFVTHRLPGLYPEPAWFRPERWVDFAPPVYAYIPFSNGPRRCIGAALAVLEMKLVLAMLLPRFRLALPDGARVDPSVSASLRPKGGLPMRVHRQDRDPRRARVTGKIREIVALE